jgi:DNA-binding NtrC family response regulator
MTRPIRVLHLEDSPRDAEMIRHRLDVEDVSCDILVANSKSSFEAALTREPFDLIISDYNLPGYDGVTALKQAQVTQPDVPVILISGTVVEEQAVKCLHIGATDYLLKDRLDRLGPAVRRALQEAETRRARKRVEGALGESEARKAAILDSVLDCIVTMDADGTVIEFNSAASRTFGYPKAEAIGHSLADLIGKRAVLESELVRHSRGC